MQQTRKFFQRAPQRPRQQQQSSPPVSENARKKIAVSFFEKLGPNSKKQVLNYLNTKYRMSRPMTRPNGPPPRSQSLNQYTQPIKASRTSPRMPMWAALKSRFPLKRRV